MSRILHPDGWIQPKGYSYGAEAQGRLLFVSGQIGSDETGAIVGDGMLAQAARALENVVTVVECGGGRREDIVRLTWYVTDIEAYRRSLKELGEVYRRVMGSHFPPMTLVAVSALVEPRACVEVEATAVLEGTR